MINIPEHNETFSFDFHTKDEYFNTSLKAVENLGWSLVSADNHTIVCHTAGGGMSLGESVTIVIEDGEVRFHSHSVNDHEITDNPNIVNAELFRKEVAAVSAHSKELEKSVRRFSRSTFSALIPSKTYFVTPILIYLNIAVFVIMVASGVSFMLPDTESLLNWGANFRPNTMTGEWWRLITSMFLHAGVLHLVMNMYALLYVGVFLEPIIGKFRFAAAYLLSGIFASLASLIAHSCTVSVGASGAIFGMYGVFLSLLTTNHIEKNARNTLLRSIGIFIVFNLLNGVKGNIDNACHIGGLISGFIIGYIYYPGIRANSGTKKQLIATSYIAVATLLTAIITLRTVTNDFAIFQGNMTKFTNMESMALEALHMNNDQPKEKLLYNLDDRGIYYWNECMKLAQENEKLNLPSALIFKNKKLEAYCKARIKMYKTLYNQIATNGKVEENQDLKDDMSEINGLMHDIKGDL